MRIVGYVVIVAVCSLAAFLFSQGEASPRLFLAVALMVVAVAGLVVDSLQKRRRGN